MSRVAARTIRTAGIYTVEDVAERLRVEPARVVWHCERAAGIGRAALFFGAWQDSRAGWIIPERAMLRAGACMALQHYTLDEVAALAGFSPRTIRERVVVVPAGVALERGRQPHQIAARFFLGTDIRVPESELTRLAAGLVTRLPAKDKDALEEAA